MLHFSKFVRPFVVASGEVGEQGDAWGHFDFGAKVVVEA